MAIDTRDKRASALSASRRLRAIHPSPDGTISAADREHVTWGYRGIAAGAATTPTGFFSLLLRRRRR